MCPIIFPSVVDVDAIGTSRSSGNGFDYGGKIFNISNKGGNIDGLLEMVF